MSFNIITYDLQIEVLTYLDIYQLSSVVPQVSKRWNKLSKDDRIWKVKIAWFTNTGNGMICASIAKCGKHSGLKATFCQLRHDIRIANEKFEFNEEKILERNVRYEILIRVSREACEKADKKLRRSTRQICVLV